MFKACLLDLGIPVVRSMGPDVYCVRFTDLADVTLAGEDTNSLPTNSANWAIQANMTMQVVHICNQCASGRQSEWWPTLQTELNIICAKDVIAWVVHRSSVNVCVTVLIA